MDLAQILTISGKPGLHKLVSQTKSGALVESLIDGKRRPIFSHEKISSLADISVFTTEEEIPITKVFQAMLKTNDCKVNAKSDPKEISSYLLEVVPTMDFERVYLSDMKKILSWYMLLKENNLLDLEPAEDTPEETEEEPNS